MYLETHMMLCVTARFFQINFSPKKWPEKGGFEFIEKFGY